MARATDFFPDPAAPTSRTVVSLRASFFACAKTCFNAGLSPTISSEPDPGRISSCTCTVFPNHTTDFARSCIVCSRSVPFSVAFSRELSLEGHNSAKGAFRTEPWERITERSTKFSSSLTFPGHPQLTNAFMVSAGMLSIFLFMRRANFCTKCRTSTGISSLRSRKDGTRIGKTCRRLVQVTAEPPFGYSPRQVAVRGCDQACIDVGDVGAAQPLELL